MATRSPTLRYSYLPRRTVTATTGDFSITVDLDRLRRARLRAGLSVEDLAAVVGVSRSTVERCEREGAVVRMRVSKACRYFAALGIEDPQRAGIIRSRSDRRPSPGRRGSE